MGKKNYIIYVFVIISFSMFSQKFEAGGNIIEILAKKRLEVPYVQQTQQNWCWAACSAMIINYFKNQNLSSCQIASLEYQFNCCGNPKPCNHQNSIDRFSEIVGLYDIKTYEFEERVSWEKIKNQIDNNQPVILRVASSYGGHVLVLFGYYINYNHTTGYEAKMIELYDPYLTYHNNHGPQYMFTINYDKLLSGYGDNYTFNWTHTIRFTN